MQSTIFCGCPSDLRGKGIRRECHPDPLDSVFDERSFGQPMCLRRYAIRNETGEPKKKKKLYRIKQYLRELESQRRCRSMLPKTFSFGGFVYCFVI